MRTVRLVVFLLTVFALLTACAARVAADGSATVTPASPPAPATPPPSPSPAPTVSSVIRTAEYTVTESGERMRVTLALRISVLKTVAAGTWIIVPLLPPEVAVVDCDLRESDGFVRRDSSGTTALLSRYGDFSFKVSFIVTPHKVGDETSINLPLVDAEISRVNLLIRRKNVEFAVPDDAVIEKCEETDEMTRVTILPGRGVSSAGMATISWFPKGARRPIGASLSAVETSVFRFADGAVRIESLVTCTVGRGTLTSLQIVVPVDHAILKVVSDGLKDWRTEEASAGKIVKLLYDRPRSGEFSIALMLEARTNFLPCKVTAQPLVVKGAERQSGTIVLTTPRAVLFREIEREGLTRLDSAEILKRTPWLRDDTHVIGYQYSHTRSKLVLQAERITPKISATLDTLFRLEHGIVHVTVAANFVVEEAATYEFSFDCPPEFSLNEIVGKGIRDYRLKDNILTVMLADQLLGRYNLSFSGQLPMKKIDGIELPLFQTRNTLKQTGSIGVAVEPEIELTPRAFEDLTQVNPRELPPWMLRGEGPGRAFAPDSKEAIEWRMRNAAMIEQGQAQNLARMLQEEATPLETRARDVKLGFKSFGFGGTLAVSVAEVQPEVAALHTIALLILDGRHIVCNDLQLEVKKRGIFETVVNVPHGFTPINVTGDGVAEWTSIAGNQDQPQVRVRFAQKMSGKIALRILAERTASEAADETLVFAGMRVAGAYKEDGTFLVCRSADVETKFTAIENAEEIDPKTLAIPLLAQMEPQRQAFESLLGLRFRVHSWKGTLHITRLVPIVNADVFYFLRLREGEMAVDALVTYSIQRAGVGKFIVRLPKGAVNSRLAGESIRTAHLEDDVWTVTLDGRVRGNYALYIQFNQCIERVQPDGAQGAEKATTGRVRFTGLVLDAVEKETGTIVVATGIGNLRPSVVETKGLHEIGRVVPLPDDMAPYRRLGRLAEYSYTNKEKSLTIEASEMAQAQVETAKVDSCELHTVLRESGEIVTYFGCIIDNFDRQFLKLRLGKDAVLWTASVSGNPVKPSMEADGTLLIPILGTDKEMKMFSLELVWAEMRPRVGAASRLSFETPWLDAGVNELTWQVYVPREYDVASESGTMTRVKDRYVALPATLFPAMGDRLGRFLNRLWRTVGDYVLGALVIVLGLLVVASLLWLLKRLSLRLGLRPATMGLLVVGIVCIASIVAAVLQPAYLRARRGATEGVPTTLYVETPGALRLGNEKDRELARTESDEAAWVEDSTIFGGAAVEKDKTDRWVSEAEYQKHLDAEIARARERGTFASQPEGQALNVGRKAVELKQRAARQKMEMKSVTRGTTAMAETEGHFADQLDKDSTAEILTQLEAAENWEVQSEEAFRNIADRAMRKKSGERPPEAEARFVEPDEPLPAAKVPGAERESIPADKPPEPHTKTAPQEEAESPDFWKDEEGKLALSTANTMVLGLNAAAAAAGDTARYVRANRGQAAGVMPIQLSIPTAGVFPRIFRQSFAGTGRGTVDIVIVARSTSMIVQLLIALILCSACVLAGRKYAAQTFVIAVASLIMLVVVMPRPETVWYAYLSSAAHALGLGAVLVACAWLCKRGAAMLAARRAASAR